MSHQNDQSLTYAELQQRVAELTELAGGLAHELRNPLSTMMVNLKLMAEDLQDPATAAEDARRRSLNRIQVLRRESERLQGLFDEFLKLAGRMSLERKSLDLRDVIHRLVEFLEPLLNAHSIELEVDVPEEPVMCEADEKLISQALLNLALNAQQAMPSGGKLAICARLENGKVAVSVTDTGVGIAPQNQDRIFRPFFSTKAGGSGLGLSITKRIIEEHGGELTFTSRVGEGTTFTMRLPHIS